MKKFLSIFVVIFILNGCATHLTDFTMISNKNVNLSKVDIDKLPTKKNIEGVDKKFVFLFIPFGQPTIKGALTDALEKGNGDLMVDASVSTTGWWFIVGETGLKIKGDVVDTRGSK